MLYEVITDRLKPGPILADCPKICLPPKKDVVETIEGLIHPGGQPDHVLGGSANIEAIRNNFV